MQVWIDLIFNGVSLYVAIGLAVLLITLIREGKFSTLVIATLSDMSLWVAYSAIAVVTIGAWWVVIFYEVFGPRVGADKWKR
jgi:hypothetical protein